MLERRNPATPLVVLLVALALLAAPGSAFAQEQENPGFMAAKGRITYGRYCANCHGPDAKGNGSIAKFLKIPPTDLTMIERNDEGAFPYERLTEVIDGQSEVRGHGSREMPIWGDVFKNPLSENYASADEAPDDRAKRMIRELIYYLETIQEDDAADSEEEPADS